MNLFNQYDLSSNKEVLLWRMYAVDATVNSKVEGTYHSIYYGEKQKPKVVPAKRRIHTLINGNIPDH